MNNKQQSAKMKKRTSEIKMAFGLLKNCCWSTQPLAAFLILAVILTDSFAWGQVNVEPNTSHLNEGDRTELLCRYAGSINYCRIEIPGENVLNLSPEWSKTPGFTYHGAGFANGECGVSIERVKANNNGQVKCFLGVQGEEFTGAINLVVALRPQQPLIQLINKAVRNDVFSEGDHFRARCIVRDGRPAANISWYLDGRLADKALSQLEVEASPADRNMTLSTTKQDIEWELRPEDDGRNLICRAHHQTDRENLPPQEAAYSLHVDFAPVRQSEIVVYGLYLDHTALINVTIHSNPPPTVEWTIDGTVLPQRTQNGRFEVSEPQPLGQHYYNVTLAIVGLTLEDTTKSYYLKAANYLGSADYAVRISSSSTPPNSGLEVGAIVGIVVAVAVLVLIVLLIIFARATGRWCFGGATLNTDIGPDSEAQINPELNEDFDGREFISGEDQHIDTTQQSEEATPPMTDKLETQKKADLKAKGGVTAPPTTGGGGRTAAVNGHQNGNEAKTNTSV